MRRSLIAFAIELTVILSVPAYANSGAADDAATAMKFRVLAIPART
jgi:hypothetical protein